MSYFRLPVHWKTAVLTCVSYRTDSDGRPDYLFLPVQYSIPIEHELIPNALGESGPGWTFAGFYLGQTIGTKGIARVATKNVIAKIKLIFVETV